MTLQHEGEEAYTYKQSYIAENCYITLTSTRRFTPGRIRRNNGDFARRGYPDAVLF